MMKALMLLCALAVAPLAFAEGKTSVYDIPIKDIDGKSASLKDYKGKVVLVVNVASKCGNTPQYTALQALQAKYAAKGFTVVGFPCNDFGAQEPGSNEEIKTFCTLNYKVSFPIMDKIHVKGAEQHPLYARLSGPGSEFPGDVKWNFGKFLIGKDGKVVNRFDPGTKPDTTEVVSAIEAALAAK